MDSKGNAALLKTTKVTEWTLNQGGYLAVLFGGFLILGCLVAYVIAVSRGNVDAFLPLISDAAGSPPQNGLFGTLICVGGMFGVMFMVLRYMIVLEENGERSSIVTAVNKLSLCVGIVSMLGITLVTGYPINFYRNRDVWLNDVGLPHMIGGVMLFAFGIVYLALQCVLTLFLRTKCKATLAARVALCLAATACFVYHMLTVPDNFGGVSHLFYMNDTENQNTTGLMPYPSTMGANLKLPIDTGGSYVSSAITEWLLVIFFCLFFFTFFNEAQQYSLLVVVETHRTRQEHQELPEDRKFSVRRISVGPMGASQIESAPAPETKKYLRRDSTCQTMSDTVDDVTVKKSVNGAKKSGSQGIANGAKKKSRDFANGAKMDIKLDPKLDAKLNKLFSDMEKSEAVKEEAKKVDQKTVSSVSTGHSISTDCEDLGDKEQKKSSRNGQSDLDKEAEKIEVLEEDPNSRKSSTSAPFLGENGNMKRVDSDRVLSSICPLSIS